MMWANVLLWAVLAQPLPLEQTSGAEKLRKAAVALGVTVDRQRRDATLAEIDGLLTSVDALGRRADDQRKTRERQAGESEAALERLYRSPTWSNIGFARAAVRYWASWLRLDRHRLDNQISDLAAARHGFQSTLPLIVYPGLVRGSWLGLGFVELSQQNYQAARVWFETVRLGGDVLADTAQRELALIAALENASAAPAPIAIIDPATADAMETEVLALLERHGKTADGAIAAAHRLRQLEAEEGRHASACKRCLGVICREPSSAFRARLRP